MVQINEVAPSRFRTGDLITIRGFGFAPTFGDNEVAIDGIPEPLQTESDTELVLFVPAGITEDSYVSVAVFRSDTLGNDGTQAWSKAPLADLRLATVAEGQIPGTTEAANSVAVEDVPQAQDYERLVTAMEFILFELLTTIGDLFGTNGTTVQRIPVGAAGNVLTADASALGIGYVAIPRRMSLQWGKETAAANTAVEGMVANGSPGIVSAVSGRHVVPFAGFVFWLHVHVLEVTGGDTLDQVRLIVNSVTEHDSGTGLGLTAGQSYTVALAVATTAWLEIEVKKLGTAGIMRTVGYVGLRT